MEVVGYKTLTKADGKDETLSMEIDQVGHEEI
jgi:hypothetical protein